MCIPNPFNQRPSVKRRVGNYCESAVKGMKKRMRERESAGK